MSFTLLLHICSSDWMKVMASFSPNEPASCSARYFLQQEMKEWHRFPMRGLLFAQGLQMPQQDFISIVNCFVG